MRTSLPFLSIIIGITCIFSGCKEQQPVNFKTICNPIDLSYRFCLDEPSRREAADPSMVLFNDEYYLFASKSGGYFRSSDLITWDLITTDDLPIEDYAPTVVVIDNEIYFLSGSRKIFKTADPKSGKWEIVNDDFSLGAADPMIFGDDDGRVYYYWGCSNKAPITGAELDRNNRLNSIGVPDTFIHCRVEKYGWERAGDYNEGDRTPWIEGAWMNKHNGKYYLQYATPGTQFKCYADGVYVSDKPLGPFMLAKSNPFAYKPEGFVNGVGHGSTFQDKYGNYWHIGTAVISVKHMFERRLSLSPVFFDNDGEMMAYTGFGDYPMIVPDKKIDDPTSLFPGWMMLSYCKKVEVSSSLDEHPAENAVNEDIRTYWSAETGNKGEFITVDLGERSDVYAVQINFAEQNTDILGRKDGIYYQYLTEYSDNGKSWKTLIDKSNNTIDAPHDYIQLAKPVKARFIKLTNIRVPSGTFAVSGLRVFGKCDKKPAESVSAIRLERAADRRVVKIDWDKSAGAGGYNVRFGYRPDKLYQNYMVYGTNEVTIRSLNAEIPYYFAVDAFNENGITPGTVVKDIP